MFCNQNDFVVSVTNVPLFCSFWNNSVFLWWCLDLPNHSDMKRSDMKRSSRFPLSVFWAYIGVVSMYLPVTVLGFVAYGRNITSNILNSVGYNQHNTSAVMLDIVLALIMLHLLFSFVIVVNPVSQQLEELLSIPQGE